MRRWHVVWYNASGEQIREKRFWTYRSAEAERERHCHSTPALPALFACLTERVGEEAGPNFAR